VGRARYRAGAWKESIEALLKSAELDDAPKGGEPRQWFFLAMAHWQLGEKEEARAWYDKAVAWMDQYSPGEEDHRQERAEAAALLGVPDLAPRKAR
jgi:hypothetical protein